MRRRGPRGGVAARGRVPAEDVLHNLGDVGGRGGARGGRFALRLNVRRRRGHGGRHGGRRRSHDGRGDSGRRGRRGRRMTGRLGPEGADLLVSSSEFTTQAFLACGVEIAPQALYLLREEREAVVRGGGGGSRRQGGRRASVWRRREVKDTRKCGVRRGNVPCGGEVRRGRSRRTEGGGLVGAGGVQSAPAETASLGLREWQNGSAMGRVQSPIRRK